MYQSRCRRRKEKEKNQVYKPAMFSAEEIASPEELQPRSFLHVPLRHRFFISSEIYDAFFLLSCAVLNWKVGNYDSFLSLKTQSTFGGLSS